jgi:hypothetical protein
MRKVLGEWLRQFTCPSCGTIGAGSPARLPGCYRCPSVMRPSNNGVIVKNWRKVHKTEKAIIAKEQSR